MAKKYIEVKVSYLLDDREQEAVAEILQSWKQYKDKDGKQPFRDYTTEEMFQVIMETGCKTDIARRIKEQQFRQGFITVGELVNKEPFRLAKERAAG